MSRKPASRAPLLTLKKFDDLHQLFFITAIVIFGVGGVMAFTGFAILPQLENQELVMWAAPVFGAAALLIAGAIIWLLRFGTSLRRRWTDCEQKYRALFEGTRDAVFMLSQDMIILECNQRVHDLLGYERHELIGQTPAFFSPPNQPNGQSSEPAAGARIAAALSGHQQNFIWKPRRKDDTLIDAEISLRAVEITGQRIVLCTLRDLSERKKAEEALRRRTEKLLERVIELNCLYHISFILSRRDKKLAEVAQKIIDIIPSSFQYPGIACARLILEGRVFTSQPFRETEWRLRTPIKVKGEPIGSIEVFYLEETPKRPQGPFLDVERLLLETIAHVLEDYVDRVRSEQALRDSQERYRAVIESGAIGLALVDIDGRIFQSNPTLQKFLGYSAIELQERAIQDITHAEEVEKDLSLFRELVAGKRDYYQMEKRYLRKDGATVWGHLTASLVRESNDSPLYVVGLVQDITKRKQAEEELTSRTEELARSNAELEQFAYIASHDLQEPLRMVTSYVQLLERRYKERLDKDADDFIGYIVAGAARMKTLIDDLLSYSRVGTRGKNLGAVNCSKVLQGVLANLQLVIEEEQATVTYDPLPVVRGDEVQLGQVLQNLLENALKFRGADPLRVHIGAERKNGVWVFSVSDNGVGIDPLYFQRIFVIFQRLHPIGRYKGTGIGLAICKKIVERHGGVIWVESQPGKGATFKFTIPV